MQHRSQNQNHRQTSHSLRQVRPHPHRGIGFEEAREIFEHPYYLDRGLEFCDQYRAIGWVGNRLFSLVFELRQDDDGEFYHLVTLWKATRREEQLYGENT